jgi:hypothetical protein
MDRGPCQNNLNYLVWKTNDKQLKFFVIILLTVPYSYLFCDVLYRKPSLIPALVAVFEVVSVEGGARQRHALSCLIVGCTQREGVVVSDLSKLKIYDRPMTTNNMPAVKSQKRTNTKVPIITSPKLQSSYFFSL